MILVTGGGGFIGSSTVDRLIGKGCDVRVLDNFTTGRMSNLDYAGKLSKDASCNFEIIRGDIRDPEIVKKSLEDVDIIFHTAAQIDVRKSVDDPVYDMDVNIKGSVNLIREAIATGAKKIIYSSSGGAIYGDAQVIPSDENTPVRPICPYGVSKYCVENYLYNFYKNYGLDYTVLRYGNVYGIRQDPLGEAGVISIFLSRVLSGKNPVIFGTGNQTRDYVSVSDVVSANILAMEKKPKHREFNVGCGIETSVNQLVEIISDISYKKIMAEYTGERKGEVYRSCLDISRIKKEMGFEPSCSIREGIAEVMEWMKGR